MSKMPRTDGKTDNLLQQLFTVLQDAHGVDFAWYKRLTVRRRITHRMVLRRIGCLPDYVHLVLANKDELEALYEDLLIKVTAFFRDPDVFDFLKGHIIPTILKNVPPGIPSRVWVPGCASGEEAYSIAVCFVEAAADRKGAPAQIFGTDISHQCIVKARQGLYPEKIKGNVSAARLRRFFVKEAGGYRIRKIVRQMCIFAEQDVISDPPLSKMDLVSCRNLLIYLDTSAQQEVLRRLHYALKPTGFLLLGPSESVMAAPRLFKEVERPQRVYSQLEAAKAVHFTRL